MAAIRSTKTALAFAVFCLLVLSAVLIFLAFDRSETRWAASKLSGAFDTLRLALLPADERRSWSPSSGLPYGILPSTIGNREKHEGTVPAVEDALPSSNGRSANSSASETVRDVSSQQALAPGANQTSVTGWRGAGDSVAASPEPTVAKPGVRGVS